MNEERFELRSETVPLPVPNPDFRGGCFILLVWSRTASGGWCLRTGPYNRGQGQGWATAEAALKWAREKGYPFARVYELK